MSTAFTLIAVTPPLPEADEPEAIVRLIEGGFDYVHLRHPDLTVTDMRRIIEAVPPTIHRRLTLHGHFVLAADYNIGGLHLNSRCPDAPPTWHGRLSRSCHSTAECLAPLTAADGRTLDYVTLSPVFDSISKTGYQGRHSDPCGHPDVLPQDAGRVIALGGVLPQHFGELRRAGYSGAAMLGAWTDAWRDAAIEEFLKQTEICCNS